MNDMTLRRPVNSKPPNASKLNPPNLTGAPNQVSTVGTARERSDHPDIKKAHDPHPLTPNVKSTANCGHFPRGEFPEDVLKKDGSASLITGNTMGSPEMARFVGLMRLCEARGRFSKRISCCISLPGLAESSYPSQGCALTGRPCTQKRTQLGRQKPAVQQWSQRQSRPELVDIQPTPGPECLFGAIGKETYSAPLAIARALFRLFQSSAVERSHYFGVQPNPSSVKKQVKFAVFSNQEFRCSPAEPDVCTAPRRGRPRS